ncbi:hypothetical protein NVP1042O_26 [Vibrio phage 1.042.O._10N.286.45.B8]|nr:hypothetical protein NVP1042O_26 [Vibrio phage 1.042.O._10N.286.45.B8]
MSTRALSISWGYKLPKVKDRHKCKLILLTIADMCDDFGRCEVPIKHISKTLDMTEFEVTESIKELYSHSIATTIDGLTYINLGLMEESPCQ